MKNQEIVKKGWKQYPKGIASMWDDYVSWDKRKEGEGNFFVNLFKKHNVHTILDIACGTGYDSIRLIKEGFKVTSCDGSKEMIQKARTNAKQKKVTLDIVQCDRRNLINKFKNKNFDAIICLGNSLTHLFSEKDRQSVMNQIYYLLNKGGILIMDQRNYDYMLDKGYKSKHKYVYCGKDIDVEIVHKDNSLLNLKYTKKGNGYFILTLYPIRVGEMVGLIKKSGFEKIESYGDFVKNFDLNDTDFIQHVAKK